MWNQLRVAWKDRCCRRRYPDLYDDALQRQSLGKLINQSRPLVVSVVGNAESVFETESGDEIDRSDVVIRINRGFISRPECQGTRTDILCLALEIAPDVVRKNFHNARIVLVTPRRWVIGRAILGSNDPIVCYPSDAWADLSARIGGARPSSGLMAIDIAKSFLGVRFVKLFGFDWKATKTHYSRRLRYGHHDWEAEQRLIRSWAADGWIALPPVNDRRSAA